MLATRVARSGARRSARACRGFRGQGLLKAGITFVFVTHDQEEALTMSDRIAVMSKGRILQIDSAERLYEAPNCREVAGFIGSMNFLEERLLRVTGEMASIDAGSAGELSARLEGVALAPSGRVTLAVRPEKLQIGECPFEGSFNCLRGRMVDWAYLGDGSHFYVEVNGLSRPLALAAQNLRRYAGSESEVEKPVWVGWPAEAGILLAGEGEARPKQVAALSSGPRELVAASVRAGGG
jgi:ABC-type Fe3+/spermidine/putrescine transport system ATPase subunit